MTAHPTGAAGFLHRFEGLRQRLPGARLPFVEALRDRAAEAFRAQGFPTRRVEAWKYTDLRPVTEAGFEEALTAVDTQGRPGLSWRASHATEKAAKRVGRLRHRAAERVTG